MKYVIDPRIKEGVRVLVIACHSDYSRVKELKVKFIGYTGIVARMRNNTDLLYSLHFDDAELRRKDYFYWSTTEVIYLENQDYVR